MSFKPFTPHRYRRRIFSELWMLGLQFLLGMILNIVGNETTGASHRLYVVILVTHIVNALGLVEGGFYIAFKAPGKLAWWAAAAVSATLGTGIMFVLTTSDVWSFTMACGFLIASWLYGMLYVQAERQLVATSKTKIAH